ncbi:MAG: hypothetical protein RBG13Loki_2442 [Promethearchaeota archaeon CR_4]|nr:MAG: hypothetical protein RBG13Loki_2442 [Candidatus Lokiarchaeota archaeon CR_4]
MAIKIEKGRRGLSIMEPATEVNLCQMGDNLNKGEEKPK